MKKTFVEITLGNNWLKPTFYKLRHFNFCIKELIQKNINRQNWTQIFKFTFQGGLPLWEELMKEHPSSLLLQSLPLQKLGSRYSPSFSRINKSGNSKKKNNDYANAKHAASKNNRNIWTIFINSRLPDSLIWGIGVSPYCW